MRLRNAKMNSDWIASPYASKMFHYTILLTYLVILDIESSRKEQNGGLEMLSPLAKRKTKTKNQELKMHTFFCLKESF